MYSVPWYKMCRLCFRLTIGESLTDIFDENIELEFVVGETINDLLHFEVCKEVGTQWLVCETCLQKLNDFRLFKNQCIERKIEWEMGFKVRREYWEFDENKPGNCREDTRKVDIKEEICDQGNESCGNEVLHENTAEYITASEMCDTEICGITNSEEVVREEASSLTGKELDMTGEFGYHMDKHTNNCIDEPCSVAIMQNGRSMGTLQRVEPARLFGATEEVFLNTARVLNQSKSFERSGNGKPEFNCKACKQDCLGNSSLKTHMILHKNSSKSTLAGNQNQGQKNLEDVEDDDDKLLQCETCDIKFTSSRNLVRHFRVHSEVGDPYGCDQCGKKFILKVFLVRHLKEHEVKEEAGQEHYEAGEGGKNKFRCNFCGKDFSNRDELNQHVAGSHPSQRPYQCKTCGESFQESKILKVHENTHAGGDKAFRCNYCEKTFTFRTSLVRHIRTHTGLRPFQCEICDKRFSDSSGLRKHMLCHTRGRQFQCKVCEKWFTQKYTLIGHMRTHSGEKPFQCTVCQKKFTEKGNLTVHMRSHTGQKPFQCSVCWKRFSVSSTLNNHMRIHTGSKPFQCHICERTFTDRSTLNKHVTRHK